MSQLERIALGVVLLFVIGFGFLLWLVVPPPHRIKFENIDKIQVGMTQREVADILGARPGYWTPGRSAGMGRIRWIGTRMDKGYHADMWIGEVAAVLVFFDKNGLVVRHFAREVVVEEETLRQKIRRAIRI